MTLMKEERRRRRRRRRKKTILGFGGRQHRNILRNISLSSLSLSIGSARNQKNLLKANGPFILCVKILIASATRFAAFGAEKEERERKKRARLLIFFAERDRESFCRAIHRLSKKRFEQNDYLILSRLTVCACVGFAVEIL
jgi:hypothetical protein